MDRRSNQDPEPPLDLVIPLFWTLYQEYPNDTDAVYNLGVAYSELGQIPKAIAILERLIELAPKHVHGLIGLGVAYIRRQKLQFGEEYLRTALKLVPNNQWALGDEERRAWMSSLPKLSIVLAKPNLSSFHLSLGNSRHVAFEYRLPASSSWCDAVLLGQNQNLPAAVILELKEWDLTGDVPGPRESLIYHHGSLLLHPADQVRGYVHYCRRFHSAVADYKASKLSQ